MTAHNISECFGSKIVAVKSIDTDRQNDDVCTLEFRFKIHEMRESVVYFFDTFIWPNTIKFIDWAVLMNRVSQHQDAFVLPPVSPFVLPPVYNISRA